MYFVRRMSLRLWTALTVLSFAAEFVISLAIASSSQARAEPRQIEQADLAETAANDSNQDQQTH
jgi:hypothetical protein